MINNIDHGLCSSDQVRNYCYCILSKHNWVCHFIWSHGLCKYVQVYVLYICLYVCMYVHIFYICIRMCVCIMYIILYSTNECSYYTVKTLVVEKLWQIWRITAFRQVFLPIFTISITFPCKWICVCVCIYVHSVVQK